MSRGILNLAENFLRAGIINIEGLASLLRVHKLPVYEQLREELIVLEILNH